MITLGGNTHPIARAEFDRGDAPADLPMQQMQLVLTRSAAQQSDLDALLAAQQDSSSAQYHQWLTPEQFGERFGASDEDVQKISSWLEGNGFQIDRVANGRNLIEFTGSASQVESTFHTRIHKYMVNGESHCANASNPHSTIQNQEDAPPCSTCGSIMIRSGACYKCSNCGNTSGCA
jgi:hypothetical protein